MEKDRALANGHLEEGWGLIAPRENGRGEEEKGEQRGGNEERAGLLEKLHSAHRSHRRYYRLSLRRAAREHLLNHRPDPVGLWLHPPGCPAHLEQTVKLSWGPGVLPAHPHRLFSPLKRVLLLL